MMMMMNLFLAFPRISCCSYSFKRNFPNSKSILSSKLHILGKNLCFHMYVSKQIINLKCETKSRQIMNYIDDLLVCRPKNIIAIGKYEINKLDIGEHGIGEHGIGEYGIGEH